MSKTTIHSDKAPAAIGPYSQSIKVGSLLFTSGQIPLVPESMVLVDGGISEQTHQVFKNLAAIADAYDSDLDQCIKLTIFLTDLSEFSKVNDIMMEYINEPFPARSTVQVAALPKDAGIEIEAILGL